MRSDLRAWDHALNVSNTHICYKVMDVVLSRTTCSPDAYGVGFILYHHHSLSKTLKEREARLVGWVWGTVRLATEAPESRTKKTILYKGGKFKKLTYSPSNFFVSKYGKTLNDRPVPKYRKKDLNVTVSQLAGLKCPCLLLQITCKN